MQGLKDNLLREKEHLVKVIEKINSDKREFPQGYLRISKDKGKIRYYHCTDDNSGVYIRKENMQLIKLLAQKSYNDETLIKSEKRLRQVSALLRDYSDYETDRTYMMLHEARKALVEPIEPTMEQKLNAWINETYTGKEFQEGAPLLFSEKGERVRSKSEKILADYFYKNKIPYKYEKPLYLMGYGTVYPDFTFFSKRLCKEIYWEHEGMMDEPKYSIPAVKKLNIYQLNGIFPGERLILTFETSQDIVNTKVISNLVEKYLI